MDESTIRLKEKIIEKESKHPSRIKPELKENSTQKLAYGSVKYYDLSMNRTSNYKFSFDKILNFEGNTLPYNMYAYARINSIFEKDGVNESELGNHINTLEILDDVERELCVVLLSYPEVISMTVNTLMFHHLCRYVYNLTSIFHKFFCSLQCLYYVDGKLDEINYSRLIMLKTTIIVLGHAFNILGINPIKKM